MTDTNTASKLYVTAATPLSRKAVLVKLTSTKPSTARREKAAEVLVRGQLGDASLTLSSHIFSGRHNPVRVVLNLATAVTSYHAQHTLAWQDRGPRILPMENYETYTAAIRKLIADTDSAVYALGPSWQGLVDADITGRMTGSAGSANPRTAESFAAEYPAFDDFREKMKFGFLFTPLPDETHFLFDLNEEDKAQFASQLAETERAAKEDQFNKVRAPLLHLIEKLKKQIGEPGAIFRDSAVENIVEECAIAESLAMGDASLLAMIAEVRVAIRPHALAPSQLRESPIVRADAAAKLSYVAAKMSFLMGN